MQRASCSQGTFGGARRDSTRRITCGACWPTSSARTAGNWPSVSGMPTPAASNGSWIAMRGTPRPSAPTCAGGSWRSWVTPRASWSSMKPASPSRDGIRSAWPASTARRWVSSPTARSASSWATPARRAMPGSTGRSSCPKSGSRTASAAARPASPADGWQRLSCGEGAQGPRLYDWAYVPLRPALRDGWVHAVLVRRHPVRTDELAYYLVYAPVDTPLEAVVAAAGARWTIEEIFKAAKGQVGLDQYEVRSWHGWYRHSTLALLALAALAIGAAKKGRPRVPSTSRSPSPKSAASWSDSSGRRPERRTRSWRGHGGAVTTRKP